MKRLIIAALCLLWCLSSCKVSDKCDGWYYYSETAAHGMRNSRFVAGKVFTGFCKSVADVDEYIKTYPDAVQVGPVRCGDIIIITAPYDDNRIVRRDTVKVGYK